MNIDKLILLVYMIETERESNLHILPTRSPCADDFRKTFTEENCKLAKLSLDGSTRKCYTNSVRK